MLSFNKTCIQLKLTSSGPRLFVPQEVKVVKGKCLSIVPHPDCRVDRQMISTWSWLLHVKDPGVPSKWGAKCIPSFHFPYLLTSYKVGYLYLKGEWARTVFNGTSAGGGFVGCRA